MSNQTDLYTQDEKRFKTILNKVSKRLISLLSQESGNLQVKNGIIQGTTENLNYVLALKNKQEEILNKAGYNELLEEFKKAQIDTFKALNKVAIPDLGFEPLFTSTQKEYFLTAIKTDITKLKGLSEQSIQSVLDIMIESIVSELDDKTLALKISKVVDNKFVRYSETYRETARNQLIQTVVDKEYDNLIEEGEDVYYEYVGADDDRTRPICQWALNKLYFTKDEKKAYEEKHGIRYNCRHNFIIIDKSDMSKQ